jgi:hypothetical protein
MRAMAHSTDARWPDWVIAVGVIALAVVGTLTVFHEEIARLRGKTPVEQPTQGVTVPSAPGPHAHI